VTHDPERARLALDAIAEGHGKKWLEANLRITGRCLTQWYRENLEFRRGWKIASELAREMMVLALRDVPGDETVDPVTRRLTIDAMKVEINYRLQMYLGVRRRLGDFDDEDRVDPFGPRADSRAAARGDPRAARGGFPGIRAAPPPPPKPEEPVEVEVEAEEPAKTSERFAKPPPFPPEPEPMPKLPDIYRPRREDGSQWAA
jgi:hypothetical protein